MDLPLIGTFAPSHAPDAGIAPDILIAQTPADVINGKDRAMEAALRLASL